MIYHVTYISRPPTSDCRITLVMFPDNPALLSANTSLTDHMSGNRVTNRDEIARSGWSRTTTCIDWMIIAGCNRRRRSELINAITNHFRDVVACLGDWDCCLKLRVGDLSGTRVANGLKPLINAIRPGVVCRRRERWIASIFIELLLEVSASKRLVVLLVGVETLLIERKTESCRCVTRRGWQDL